jgi:signal peptidase I
MKLKFRSNRKEKEKKSKTFFQEWRDSIVFAVVVATLVRWSTVEAFVVPTGSMENTIMTGDFLFVSKFHYGSRTPATPLQVPLTHQKIWGTEIPSYLDWIELPTYRFPGVSKIKREDVVVFNVPPLSQNEGVKYPMDLKTFYVKRCVALPGDRFEIRNKEIFANDVPLDHPENMKFSYQLIAKDEINRRNLSGLGLSQDDYYLMGRSPGSTAVYRMYLTEKQVNSLKEAPYVISITQLDTRTDDPVYGTVVNTTWNGDQYGPITIPSTGMKININDSTLALYGELIMDYEHNTSVVFDHGKLRVDGREVSDYTFKQNYYFMMGDNRHNSLDSRYWGFVPEDHIVGKPLFVWMSIDDKADLLHKIRWNRLFTRVE